MKVVWRFIHKIIVKFCQKLILISTFCQFSSLTLSIYWQKQRIFQWQYLKNRMSDLAEIWELSLICLSLCKLAYFNLKLNNFILPLIPPKRSKWSRKLRLCNSKTLEWYLLYYTGLAFWWRAINSSPQKLTLNPTGEWFVAHLRSFHYHLIAVFHGNRLPDCSP